MMKNRYFSLLLFALLLPLSTYAQGKVLIDVTNMENEVLRKKMSANATALVSELNRAYIANELPNLTKISVTNEVRENIKQIWESSPYRCVENELSARSLITNKGFQIRNLPFIIKEGNENQDVVLNFTSTGTINAFYFAIEDHKYQTIINAQKSVTDLRCRQMILNFVENFRTAYNRKDLPLIDAMYSDHALIITGNVYTKTDTESTGLPQEMIAYVKSNKQEYIKRLKRVFEVNKFINISFDEINVLQHPVHEKIYGVTLKQAWRTTNYNDDGWLFLAIHFETEDEMYVDVRTWQPYMLNGAVLPASQRISLSDFDF